MMWSIVAGVIGTFVKISCIFAAFVLAVIGTLTLLCAIEKGPVVRFHYHIKFALTFIVLFSSSVLIWPIFLLKPRNVLNSAYSARFVKLTTAILGITNEIRNSKVLEEDRGAIVVLNHQSALDSVLLFILIPILKKATPVIKKDLFYVFPYGPCTWLCGAFFVDRGSPKAAYNTLKHCADEMNDKKIKLYMFPEGTRSRVRGMLPFKRGAFKTAIMGQVPIVPIVIAPYYFIDHKKKEFNKGHVICKALDPIPTKGMTDADHEELMERTRTAMLAEYERLAAEVDEKSLQKEWRDKERPRVYEDGKGL